MPTPKKPVKPTPKIYRDQSANMKFSEAEARSLGIPTKGKDKPAKPEKLASNNIGGKLKFRKN